MKDKEFIGHNPFPELSPIPKNINEIQKSQREENEKNPGQRVQPGEKFSDFPLPGDKNYPGNEKHDGYNKYDSMLELQKQAEENLSDPEVAEAHELIKQAVQEKGQPNLLGKVRDVASSNAFRAAFLSVMLFSKVGQASAENLSAERQLPESQVEVINNKTIKEKNAEGNYVAGYAEFLKIKATNYFETDKAEIGEEAAKEIQDNFHKFLDGINNENFKDVMSKEWVIKGSSDERATKKWGGSNENLTKARSEALFTIIKKAINDHKYKREQRLTEEQTWQIVFKKIDISYPQGREGKENGVTYITDKINPETGEKYTDAEVAKIKKEDPEEYQKLLESCRFTNFETESDFFADAKNFDQVHFLIDESGSMAKSKIFISNHLRSIEMNKKINLNLYSDQIDPQGIECFNNSEAADKILKLDTEGSFRERQVSSTLGLINKIAAEQESKGGKEEKETHKIYVATDEAIQNTNSAVLELLQTKAKEVGADVEFLIGYSRWVGNEMQGYQKNEVIKLSLNDLAKKVENIKKKEIAKGINKDVKSQKVDDFYKQNYEAKKAEFTAYLANSRSTEFLNLLKSKGYGETAEEVADSLDQRLSGSGNYNKLNEIINIQKIHADYYRKLSGGGGDARLPEAVFNSIRALRDMIETHNEMTTVLEATKGMPEDEIPDIKDHILINVIDDVAPVKLPVKGPRDLSANLYYK